MWLRDAQCGMAPPELGVGGQPGSQPSFSNGDCVPSEEDSGTHLVGFLIGESWRDGEGVPKHILEVLISAKHLSLNCWFPTRLLPPTSLSDPRSILGVSGLNDGT